MSADPLQRVDLGQEATRHVEFSYSVKWLATDVPFAERMHRYAQYSFLPQSFEIHWLSIINSFVLVRAGARGRGAVRGRCWESIINSFVLVGARARGRGAVGGRC